MPVQRVPRVLAIALAVTGTLAAPGLASAAGGGCQSWTGAQPPSPGSTDNSLRGVTVLSACNAWAVGFQFDTGASQTLIEHWNGSSWTVVPSSIPGAELSLLFSIRSVSPANIWAVGQVQDALGENHALIEHWNGTTWKAVPSPDPAGSQLDGVAVVSARDVWAVGSTFTGSRSRNLILRWNGRTWKQVPAPDPGSAADNDYLTAVSASGPRDVWAVGQDIDSTTDKTVILRWNGTRWSRVPSPNPETHNDLSAVAATSPANAWAAGTAIGGGLSSTLILHWNGRAWTRVRSPGGDAGTASFLTGLAATTERNVLAVGVLTTGSAGGTLVLRWTGSAWRRMPSPNLGPSSNNLFAVAASSAGNIWAVGTFRDGPVSRALAIHCC